MLPWYNLLLMKILKTSYKIGAERWNLNASKFCKSNLVIYFGETICLQKIDKIAQMLHGYR